MKGSLENKELVFTIEFRIDFEYLIEEGIENMLEEMRQYGATDVIDVKMIDKVVA